MSQTLKGVKAMAETGLTSENDGELLQGFMQFTQSAEKGNRDGKYRNRQECRSATEHEAVCSDCFCFCNEI